MPSPAQIRGKALIASLMPPGSPVPELRIRARGGNATAFHIWPTWQHGEGGEWMRTIVVPDEDGAGRHAAIVALRHQLARLVETQDMSRALAMLGPDAMIPVWAHHCPLALRVALDEAGVDVEDRIGLLASDRRTLHVRGCAVTVHEVTSVRASGWPKTIRRISIKGPGVHYKQGVNRSEIIVDGVLPTSMLTAVEGRPACTIVDLPGLATDAIVVRSCSSHPSRGTTTFEVTRAFSLLASPPGARTMP